MKVKFYILFLFCVCCFTQSYSQSHIATPKSVNINSNCRGYYEFLPTGYADIQHSHNTYPLLIDIQGTGSEGDGSEAELQKLLNYGAAYYITEGKFPSRFSRNGKSYSFIVISVQFMQRGGGTDLADVISFVRDKYRIDTGRIYVAGYSGGGEPVWRYPCMGAEHSNTIAALVAVAGVNTNRYYTGIGHIASTALPVWALHSKDDDVMMTPVENSVNFVNKINELEPAVPAMFTQLTGPHKDTWSKVYDPAMKYSSNGESLNMYEWMLQYQRVSAVLPVELVSYSVVLSGDGEKVAIEWKTATEYNNHSYVIERSLDGEIFDDIATVPAAVNGEAGASYAWYDSSPVHGKSWYRVVQLDRDGKKNYFQTREIVLNGMAQVKVFPTLVQDNTIKISFNGENRQPTQISIVDMNGALVYQNNTSVTSANTIVLTLHKWSQGLHVVEVRQKGKVHKFKVMKI